MNLISRILLGTVVLAAAVCLWYVLTRKNAGCSGNCAGCTQACKAKTKDEK